MDHFKRLRQHTYVKNLKTIYPVHFNRVVFSWVMLTKETIWSFMQISRFINNFFCKYDNDLIEELCLYSDKQSPR